MSRLRILADHAPRYLFVLSLCLFSLLYGVIAGHYELFPSRQLRDANAAATALLDAFDDSDSERSSTTSGPAVTNHAGRDDGALILVSGGRGYLKSYRPDGGCIAWLMDRAGKIQHVWEYPPDLWNDLKGVQAIPGKSGVYPVDVHLLPDGGLLVSFQGYNTWPYAIGLARLDKDSKVVWNRECYAHHWFAVTPEQRIITPTLKVFEGPYSIGQTRARITGPEGKILEDMITVMTLDGEVLSQHSMLEAVDGSGLIGLCLGVGDGAEVKTDDPLHLNSIERVGTEVAAAHDQLHEDDLLVSFRNVNTVAILDHETFRIKWAATGWTLRQHSPHFWGSDRILVFDNLGGDESLGGTRLVDFGFPGGNPVTVFPRRDRDPQAKIFSVNAGHIDVHPTESAALMAVTRQSRVIEVDLVQGDVLWEYQFGDPTTKTARPIMTAKYCYDVSFEMNQGGTTP